MALIDIKQLRGLTQGSILFLGTSSVVTEDFTRLNYDYTNNILNVNGQIRIQDGSEAAGYVLVSDGTGLATWTSSTTQAQSLDLQQVYKIVSLRI
jgi:hypothetical protein